jgi:hypothetical protein
MKAIVTILFLAIRSFAIAQSPAKKPDTVSVQLSAYEKSQVTEHENIMHEVQKHNQEYLTFLGKYLSSNNIDPARVSLHQDSLRFIPPNKFLITFKPKKK